MYSRARFGSSEINATIKPCALGFRNCASIQEHHSLLFTAISFRAQLIEAEYGSSRTEHLLHAPRMRSRM